MERRENMKIQKSFNLVENIAVLMVEHVTATS